MSHGRIYAFRFGAFLTCLDAKTGQAALAQDAAERRPRCSTPLGGYLNRQDWRTNWRTTAYLKCSDKALYFAGPQVAKLVAVSAADGRVLWQHPYSNYQLVLRDDGLYALSGQVGAEVGMGGQFRPGAARIPEPSRKFDPLTGQVLAEIKLGRRACTRPTGSIDAVFCRASGGSTRLDVSSNQLGTGLADAGPVPGRRDDRQRPAVLVAVGVRLQLDAVRHHLPGAGGRLRFDQPATDAERLESAAGVGRRHRAAAVRRRLADVPRGQQQHGDDGGRGARDGSASCGEPRCRKASRRPRPPRSAGWSSWPARTASCGRWTRAPGKPKWTAFTGGAIRLPPTIAEGRALVGSGDGWVYAWEAATGRLLWRFRAAPVERRIPVYGQLLSTWPAASGVLVEDGVAYVAAGIVNYDGTHVYALDAATGRIKWQNNATGHLDPVGRTGVSVQGQMLVFDGRLWLAGGNVVSPAVFDLQDGRCLNDPAQHVRRTVNNNVPASESPRGCELYRIGSQVFVSGKPYYAHPQYPVYDWSVTNKTVYTRAGDRDLAWFNNAKLACYARSESSSPEAFARAWGKAEVAGLTPLWTHADAQRPGAGGRQERRRRGHGHRGAGVGPERRQAAVDAAAARPAGALGLGAGPRRPRAGDPGKRRRGVSAMIRLPDFDPNHLAGC